MKQIIKIILSIVIIALCSCERIEKHDVTCKVYSIEKQVEISGYKESIDTNIYWLVTTDNGSYFVTTSGLWACPEAVGIIKENNQYTFTVDGWFKSSILGEYPYIVKVKTK